MDFFTQLFSSLDTKDSWQVLLFLFVAWLLGLLAGWLLWGSRLKQLMALLTQRENELTTLRAQLKSTEEQLAAKEADLKKANDEIDALHVKLRKYSEENGQLYANLDTCNDERAKLEAALKAAGGDTAMMAAAPPAEPDDLKIVEGIGPKIEQLLNEGGIYTFRQLASTATERLQAILDAAGSHFRIHDPASWPEQARLAAEGQWDKLKEYQDFLIAGRNPDNPQT